MVNNTKRGRSSNAKDQTTVEDNPLKRKQKTKDLMDVETKKNDKDLNKNDKDMTDNDLNNNNNDEGDTTIFDTSTLIGYSFDPARWNKEATSAMKEESAFESNEIFGESARCFHSMVKPAIKMMREGVKTVKTVEHFKKVFRAVVSSDKVNYAQRRPGMASCRLKYKTFPLSGTWMGPQTHRPFDEFFADYLVSAVGEACFNWLSL